MPGVEGDKFAKAILAILWRASVSGRDNFKSLSLGPYEMTARDVLFGACELSAFGEYELIINRYKKPVHQDLCSHPVQNRRPQSLHIFAVWIWRDRKDRRTTLPSQTVLFRCEWEQRP